MSSRPATQPASGEAGFTLVEVLVAFTIIALTLTMAMRVLTQGAGLARRGPLQAARVEESASIMAQFIAGARPMSRDSEGTFADGSRWHMRIRDVSASLAPRAKPHLMRFELFLGRAVGAPVFATIAAAGTSP